MYDSLWLHGLYSPWNSVGHNTGVGSLSLLQGIFPTQESNQGLLHCRQILYQLSQKGSLRILEWVAYPFSSGSSQPRNQTRISCIAGESLPIELSVQFSSVYSLSRVRLFATPWITARQASLSITISRSWLKLSSIESVMPSSHLISVVPFSSCPQSPQHQSLFQWVNSSHEVAKVLEFQL